MMLLGDRSSPLSIPLFSRTIIDEQAMRNKNTLLKINITMCGIDRETTAIVIKSLTHRFLSLRLISYEEWLSFSALLLAYES